MSEAGLMQAPGKRQLRVESANALVSANVGQALIDAQERNVPSRPPSGRLPEPQRTATPRLVGPLNATVPCPTGEAFRHFSGPGTAGTYACILLPDCLMTTCPRHLDQRAGVNCRVLPMRGGFVPPVWRHARHRSSAREPPSRLRLPSGEGSGGQGLPGRWRRLAGRWS